MNFEIRTMSPDDLITAVEWAASEGWNPGLEDAATFHAIDPDGFLMGWLDERPIASISAVDWGAGFGFIGLYIVVPEFRGQGYGIKLWHAAMERLRDKTIGLDGVVAQQSNYARSGFALAHRNLRFEGAAGRLAGEEYGSTPGQDEADSLLSLDLAPSSRTGYLQRWLGQGQAIVLRGEESLVVARPCRTGYKIGPLIAPDLEEAQRLLGAVCARLEPETPVFIDVPETNSQALALVNSYGMTMQFETARMYHGESVPFDHTRWFGVTTLELG